MDAPRITPLGESAWLVRFEPRLSAEVNARVLAAADAIAASGLAGIRDVVPAAASLAVHVDPSAAEPAAVAAVIARAVRQPASRTASRLVDIPVCYDSAFAPDLEDVAAFAGIPPAEVIARHAAPEYRVFMLGFLPGFAYLGVVNERIAAPRLAAPRPRVPAGSVGVAGRQTGIYPVESPGGWRIIGRTPLTLFDERRSPPALLRPGDRVRFVPVDAQAFAGLQTTSSPA